MTPAVNCHRCGAQFAREIPAGLHGAMRDLLEQMPSFCDQCVERAEAEDERETRDRDMRDAAERLRRRRQASGIPGLLRELTWANVADAPPGPLAAARAWAAGEISGLLLAGAVGIGKTWLAAAASRARLEHGALRWFSVPVLFARLGLAFASDGRQDALGALIGGGALVLDDLDKVRATEYAAEQLFAAIDHRVTVGAPLLVTTNLELGALAAKFPQPFGEAIASRLAGYCEAFAMEGRDRRMERYTA